jgi:tRNA/rRNA methyltransferase
MANFSLSELRIVQPRDGWPNAKALSAASGADALITGAKVFDALSPAIADLHFVYATTARPRGMIKTVITPEMAGTDMRARIGRDQRVGILFGRERWGLDNDEVALADCIISAPVNPAFASLNIAQAVLLIGYEWYKGQASSIGQGTPELPAIETPGLRAPDTRPATKQELEGFFHHLEAELDEAGFYKTAEKKPGMVRNMRNLFLRAGLTEQEVRSLRGMVASLARFHLRPKREDRG